MCPARPAVPLCCPAVLYTVLFLSASLLSLVTVHSEKNELLAFGHKWVKLWVFLEFFLAIPYGILFQLCFWSFFVQKASHSKNRISARLCPKSTELGKPSKSRPFDPAWQQCILRFEPQFRHPFWTLFQISKFTALHCVRWNHEKPPNTGARQSQSPSFYEWTVVGNTRKFAMRVEPGVSLEWAWRIESRIQ